MGLSQSQGQERQTLIIRTWQVYTTEFVAANADPMM